MTLLKINLTFCQSHTSESTAPNFWSKKCFVFTFNIRKPRDFFTPILYRFYVKQNNANPDKTRIQKKWNLIPGTKIHRFDQKFAKKKFWTFLVQMFCLGTKSVIFLPKSGDFLEIGRFGKMQKIHHLGSVVRGNGTSAKFLRGGYELID